MEHHMIRRIPECHIIETYIAFEFLIGNCTVCLVRMFPRPETGTLLTFCKTAVRIPLRIDKSHITVIHFRLFVHHPEDTLRTCKSHDDRVELLRHLHERLGKTLRKLQV